MHGLFLRLEPGSSGFRPTARAGVERPGGDALTGRGPGAMGHPEAATTVIGSAAGLWVGILAVGDPQGCPERAGGRRRNRRTRGWGDDACEPTWQLASAALQATAWFRAGLDDGQREVLDSALADAAGYRELRAPQASCADCDASPNDLCADHSRGLRSALTAF
jgi:hypothetical protein